MDDLLVLLILFVFSWLVSAIIIFFATKIMAQREGFMTAMSAALIGSVIFAAVYFFIESGFWSSLIGGFAWLFALKILYRVGWIKSALIAIIIWILNSLAGNFLPLLF